MIKEIMVFNNDVNFRSLPQLYELVNDVFKCFYVFETKIKRQVYKKYLNVFLTN